MLALICIIIGLFLFLGITERFNIAYIPSHQVFIWALTVAILVTIGSIAYRLYRKNTRPGPMAVTVISGYLIYLLCLTIASLFQYTLSSSIQQWQAHVVAINSANHFPYWYRRNTYRLSFKTKKNATIQHVILRSKKIKRFAIGDSIEITTQHTYLGTTVLSLHNYSKKSRVSNQFGISLYKLFH